jgi:hypothetical protein
LEKRRSTRARIAVLSATLGFRIDANHSAGMDDTEKQPPVMLPFRDKDGPGWHVIIRYHTGHERRIDGFATEQDAMAWMVENAGELDQ